MASPPRAQRPRRPRRSSAIRSTGSTSAPTRTELAGGYYLICNLPPGLAPVQGTIVTQKGSVIAASPKYMGEPGLYPEAR